MYNIKLYKYIPHLGSLSEEKYIAFFSDKAGSGLINGEDILIFIAWVKLSLERSFIQKSKDF